MNVSIRAATLSDAPAIAQWYDEDLLRRADHQEMQIQADGHRRRIETILADPDRRLLIVPSPTTP